MLAFARPASAFPSTRLVYVRGPGAEQCPDQAVVRKAVSTRLGYDPFFPNSDKTIIARVLRQADHLTAQVELIDEHQAQVGLREFSAELDHCDDLIRAVALSISIAIDPKSAETYAQGPVDEPPETSEKEPESQPEANSRESAPSPSLPARAAPREPNRAASTRAPGGSLQGAVGLAALGTWNTAPTLTLGASLFGALRWQAWSIALEGRADLPAGDREHGVPLRTSTLALNAVPCFHFGVGFACAVSSLRWLTATRTDGGADGGTHTYWALGGRAGAELPLASNWVLLGYLDGMAVPRPLRVAAASVREAWKQPVFGADLAIAAALHF